MNNFYRYNLQNKIDAPNMKEVKLIVLDSYLAPINSPDNRIIPAFIESNLSLKKNRLLYNYIIDKAGDIHELFPMDYAAHCCIFSEYSYEAAKLFPHACYIIDSKVIPIEMTLDQEVISICTVTHDNETTYDTGHMTSECYKSLHNLIEYIIDRLSNEYAIVLNSNSIYLRSILAANDKLIGHMLFKKSVSQLLILKRNITHSVNISRHSTIYKTMFNYAHM
jgi:hypothetical protein